jgi:pyruvate/2-oxoglutarate dehydrogenase complex dihydrolipoamide dehydrogenase (E3) component
MDGTVLPAVVFTDPEIARVGLSEQEARELGTAFETTRFDLAELDRAITDGCANGFVKVLTVPGRDRILGATIVGEHAGELIAEYALAMRQRIGLNRILGTVHAYPTWSEANKHAAGAWRRAHAPQAMLRWVERLHRWNRRSP